MPASLVCRIPLHKTAWKKTCALEAYRPARVSVGFQFVVIIAGLG